MGRYFDDPPKKSRFRQGVESFFALIGYSIVFLGACALILAYVLAGLAALLLPVLGVVWIWRHI